MMNNKSKSQCAVIAVDTNRVSFLFLKINILVNGFIRAIPRHPKGWRCDYFVLSTVLSTIRKNRKSSNHTAHTHEFVNKRMRTATTPTDWMKLHYLSLALCATTLCLCESYTLRNSVSWAVTSNDVVVEGDLDAGSEEEVAPALLDNGGLWKQAYPPSLIREVAEKPKEIVKAKNEDAAPVSSASRVFSYRMEEVKAPASAPSPPPHQETARTARYIAHYSDWGHLATISRQDMVLLLQILY